MELFSNHFNSSCNFKQFSSKVKRDPVFKESIGSVGTQEII